MIIRRIVGGVLAAGAIASGVGILASPTAAALPRVCDRLIPNVQSAVANWQYMNETYGPDSAGTQAAYRLQTIAMARADAAGCFG